MPRTVIIINPISGPKRRGTGAERVDIATRALDRLGAKGEVRVTERGGHAHELALEAAASGADLVIGWGGDGTINEVARALVQRDVEGDAAPAGAPALGIIPGGSGNGLARELGIPFDPAKAIEHALRAKPRVVDAGRAGRPSVLQCRRNRARRARGGSRHDARPSPRAAPVPQGERGRSDAISTGGVFDHRRGTDNPDVRAGPRVCELQAMGIRRVYRAGGRSLATASSTSSASAIADSWET